MLKCAHLPGNPEHNIFLLWVCQWPWISTPPAPSTWHGWFLVTQQVQTQRQEFESHRPGLNQPKWDTIHHCVKIFVYSCSRCGLMKRKKTLATFFQPIASSYNNETMQNRHGDHVIARTLWSHIFIWNGQNVRNEPPKFLKKQINTLSNILGKKNIHNTTIVLPSCSYLIPSKFVPFISTPNLYSLPDYLREHLSYMKLHVAFWILAKLIPVVFLIHHHLFNFSTPFLFKGQ